MATKQQLAFAQQVYTAARNAETEINPAFVTAQAMLETGWGKRVIGRATSLASPRAASGRATS